MRVKALWGFMGEYGYIRNGETIEVSNEYGHALIGKGLAKEVGERSKPKSSKQAAPKENK